MSDSSKINADGDSRQIDLRVIAPDIWALMEIAESANPPERCDKYFHEEIVMEAKDGWKVSFFYDGDELDYISEFIKPDGTKINFWDWDEVKYSEDKHLMMCWRSVGDLERLRALGKIQMEEEYRKPRIEEFIDGFTFEIYSEGCFEANIEDFAGWYKYTMGKDNWRDTEDLKEELDKGNIRAKFSNQNSA